MIGLSILSGSHRELIPAVMSALREAGVQAPVVVGGIIPDQDVAALRRTPASRPSTRPRTSTSPASCGTSSPSLEPAPTGRRSPRGRHGHRLGVSADGAGLAARLRERDLSAAPAALNLLESTAAADREQAAALLAGALARRARRRGPGPHRRRHRAPRAPESRHSCRRCCGAGARPRRTVAMLAVDPSSRRSGGVAARRPGAHRLRPRRPGRADPLDRRRGAARRPGRGRRAPRRRRSRGHSTSSSSRRSASGRPRRRSPTSPTRSRSSCSPAAATSCSS